MFKIGEFSKITQVSIRMLRYYDENELLIPSNIDSTSGYRMYSADQIEQLNKIIFLKNLGFSVKEIRTMLLTWNHEAIREDLLNQIEKTKINIQLEQDKLIRIKGYLEDLDRQDKVLNIQVVIKSIPSYHVISLRKNMKDYFCEGLLWNELSEHTSGLEKNVSFSIYHDLDYREQDVDIEACVVVDGKYNIDDSKLLYRQVAGVKIAACFIIYGPYENISIAYKEFACWLEQHPEYEMSGENRQICHVSMCHTKNPEEYITELQIPLEYAN